MKKCHKSFFLQDLTGFSGSVQSLILFLHLWSRICRSGSHDHIMMLFGRYQLQLKRNYILYFVSKSLALSASFISQKQKFYKHFNGFLHCVTGMINPNINVSNQTLSCITLPSTLLGQRSCSATTSELNLSLITVVLKCTLSNHCVNQSSDNEWIKL